MPEPNTQASSRSTQAIKVIESSPLNPASWEELAENARGQNDPLSIKSLEIIIEGLKQIETMNAEAKEKDAFIKRISPMSMAMFVRLAKAYNSPTLLKEVGLIYLRDLNLPGIALLHFERSIRLGGPEKELRPLSEAAAVAVQRLITLSSGQEAGHSGITTSQHAKPVAPDVIRKTGKILMPARFTQTATSKLTTTSVGLEPETLAPLPATTVECLNAAHEAIEHGRWKWAESLLRKANEQPAEKSEMWQAWTDLGQAAYEIGLYPLVEAAFLEAYKYDPHELASHFNVALGHHLNDKYEDALASYQKANQLEPKHPKVWCNLGVLHFQMEQYPEAESALHQATIANPEYARAWDNLAAALGAQDKLDEALTACERAIALRPDYPEAYFKMGVIHFSRNDFSRAVTDFRRAALLPALAAYCDAFEAMIHARLEQTEAAEAAVLLAVKADPKCDLLWMAWNDIGLAWYSAGNYSRAVTAYGEATMIKPDESGAWFNLGVSFHKLGDLEAARDAYQQAVDLKEAMAEAWHNLGIVCAQTSDLKAAMSAFRQEVGWTPGNVRAWYDYAVTLDKLGRKDEARVAFAKADSLSQAPPPPPKEENGATSDENASHDAAELLAETIPIPSKAEAAPVADPAGTP